MIRLLLLRKLTCVHGNQGNPHGEDRWYGLRCRDADEPQTIKGNINVQNVSALGLTAAQPSPLTFRHKKVIILAQIKDAADIIAHHT